MHKELSDAIWAVLYHAYNDAELDAETLAMYAAFDPPLPYRRGDFSQAEALAALLDGLASGLLLTWTEDAIAIDRARWVSEPLFISSGVNLELEPETIGLTRAGWELCDNRWGLARQSALYHDDAPGSVRVLADSEAACMTKRDEIVAQLAASGWTTYGPIKHPGPATQIGPVERVRGWWYNRFSCIKPGYQCVIEYSI
jgi:hypothetical protein